MDLMPTAEQDAIRDSVRAFLEKELPMERVRALAGAPADAYAALWRGAAALGFFGLGLPEAVGGAGYAVTEEMVLFEELGRALAPGPWLGTVLAAHALATAGAAAPRGVLERLLAGELRVAACVDPAGGALSIAGATLSGARRGVLGAGLADAFLVVDDAAVLFVATGDGVTVEARASLDETNPGHPTVSRDPAELVESTLLGDRVGGSKARVAADAIAVQ